MEIRILGSLDVVEDGRVIAIASQRQRALLALLIIHLGRPVTTDHILDELWEGSPPESGASSVAFHVWKLRAALDPGRADGRSDGRAAADGRPAADGHGPITTESGGYALRIDPAAIDGSRFEALATEGHRRLADDPAEALARLTDALALWRGDPFGDLADLAFLQPETARLRELRLRALEDRFEAGLSLDRARDIVGDLESLVAEEPLREHPRALLMRALYAAGRQADALRIYQVGRHLLAEELGIDPSPELQALELAILRQDPALRTAGSAAGPRNPYKGLRPFAEADAGDFFGREMFSARLVERVEEVGRAGGLLLLVGPSGSGKSSVIRAGLLPMLREPAPDGERWRIAVLLPGSRPEEALRRALDEVGPGRSGSDPAAGTDPVDVASIVASAAAADHRRLLLVIDQLEELFAFATDPDGPSRFLRGIAAALTGPPPRPVVVASLRADWFDRPLMSAELGTLIRDGIEVVGPLTGDELERAIVRPAAGVGVELEPGLVADLQADVVDRPGALPLLQFALTELFERADGGRLTRESYAAIGGVAGAVGRRAESVFASLDERSRDLARQLFLRMVAVNEGRTVAARRVSVDDVRSLESAPDRVDGVLEAFGRWRLLAFDRDPRTGRATVEPAHEALLTHWQRLAGWIQEAEEGLWMQARLGAAATEWSASGRDPGFLLTGGRLDLFEGWSRTTDIRLDALERDLLQASLLERQRAEMAERERRDQERRLERRASTRLRALVAVLLVGVIGIAGFLTIVWRQGEDARRDGSMAAARELAVASNGRLDTDPTLALLLAIESARATAERGWITEEALDALHWAIQGARVPYPTESAPVTARIARDGPRGVYLLPVADLIELARDVAGRSLTTSECQTYLHRAACPLADDVRGQAALAVMTTNGLVAMEDLADVRLPGAKVKVVSQLPFDLSGALSDYAASGPAIAIPARDATTALGSALEGADIAILARLDDVADLARAGSLLDLQDILTPTEVAALRIRPLVDVTRPRPGPGWLSGKPYPLAGVPIAAVASGLLWYPADAFAAVGYEPPTTWAELEQLIDRMIADGRTPWCSGLLGGEHDGTNAADLIEDLVIDGSTLAFFDYWASGLAAFDVSIEAAFRRYHALIHLDGAVLGGPGAASRTPAAWAPLQMGSGDLPACWLIHASGDQRARWEGTVREDLTPIRFPIRESGPDVLRGRVYTLVVLRDRPEVRALARYLLSDDLGSQLIRSDAGSGLVPLASPGVQLDRTPSERSSADLVEAALEAETFLIDASDRMPAPLGAVAFPEAALRVAEIPTGSGEAGITRELEQLERIRVGVQP